MMNNLNRIIWLASFPKSGNTWMRSFLAHILMPPDQVPDLNNLRQFTTGDVRKDFFDKAAGGVYSGNTFEEWLNMRPLALRAIAASKPSFHFVKTHCQARRMGQVELIPSEVTAAAIYIIRNPFDLAPSFARHLSVDLDEAIQRMTQEDAVVGTDNGIFEVLGRWDQHIDFWANSQGLAKHIVRYEDMLTSPKKTFGDLLKTFLKVPVTPQQLKHAIRATDFKSMQKHEADSGFFEKPAGMDKFFAKGQAGVWRQDLTPDQVSRIREEFKPTLKQWYPELLKETEVFLKSA